MDKITIGIDIAKQKFDVAYKTTECKLYLTKKSRSFD